VQGIESAVCQHGSFICLWRRHTAHSGSDDESGVWAETKESEVANAVVVEKRILVDGVVWRRVKQKYSYDEYIEVQETKERPTKSVIDPIQ